MSPARNGCDLHQRTWCCDAATGAVTPRRGPNADGDNLGRQPFRKKHNGDGSCRRRCERTAGEEVAGRSGQRSVSGGVGETGGKGGVLYVLSPGSYRIRILLYIDVPCVYPVEYMYPECILNRGISNGIYMYPNVYVKKDTYPYVRYISYDSQSDRYKCIP